MEKLTSCANGLMRQRLPYNRRWVVGGWLAAAGLLLASGCTAFRQQTLEHQLAADQLAARGQEAMRCGHHDQAIRLLQGAVRKKPNDISTRCQLAEVLAECGQLESAIEQMQAAIACTEAQPQLLVRMAELYGEIGQWESASLYVERALRADPDCVSAWRFKGDLAVRAGDMRGALAHYHRALATDPQAVDIWLKTAELYRRTNRPERALSTLEHLVQRHPPGAAPIEWLIMQGQLLVELEQPDRAIELLSALIERDDATPAAYVELSRAQLFARRIAEAQGTLVRGQQRFPDDTPLAQALTDLRTIRENTHGVAHRGE